MCAGCKLYEPVDFISTVKYKDKIFKVPGQKISGLSFYGKVTVLKDGSVDLDFYGFGDALKKIKLRSGWKGQQYKAASRDPAILNLFKWAENR